MNSPVGKLTPVLISVARDFLVPSRYTFPVCPNTSEQQKKTCFRWRIGASSTNISWAGFLTLLQVDVS